LERNQKKANTGTNFKANEPHDTFSSPSVYRQRINEYFAICVRDNKAQPLPGLCLYLGLRTKVLTMYDPPEEFSAYRHLTDYALQRIEAYAAEHFFKAKGATKGVEFLMQNTVGWANKSDVNSKQTLELTEKEKLKQMPEEQLRERVKNMIPKLEQRGGVPRTSAQGVIDWNFDYHFQKLGRF
jgi:hypothetical protein